MGSPINASLNGSAFLAETRAPHRFAMMFRRGGLKGVLRGLTLIEPLNAANERPPLSLAFLDEKTACSKGTASPAIFAEKKPHSRRGPQLVYLLGERISRTSPCSGWCAGFLGPTSVMSVLLADGLSDRFDTVVTRR